MTPEQKAIVQTTFELAAPMADEISLRFYRRLFELDPSVRAMFPEDMAEQRKKLMTMLAFIVRGLDKLDQLVTPIQNLGTRHVAYKVQDSQYATVGQALLDTLAGAFGDQFTDEVREAWTAAYTLVAQVMMQGRPAMAA